MPRYHQCYHSEVSLNVYCSYVFFVNKYNMLFKLFGIPVYSFKHRGIVKHDPASNCNAGRAANAGNV